MIEKLKQKIGDYYAGCIYGESASPLLWLINKVLSRVKMAEEHVQGLRELSEKGIVVHALKNKSQLNALILWNISKREGIAPPDYCHGINMMLWQPFFTAMRTLLSLVFNNPYKRRYLMEVTRKKQFSVIYLRGSEFIGSNYEKDPLLELMNAQKELDIPIYLVPQLVSYGRRREKKDKTLIDLLFGEVENPGTLRRIINFARFSKKAFVITAEPVNLKEYLEKQSGSSLSPGTVAYLLRRKLIGQIDEEKMSVVGPVLKSREEIIEMVLRDPRSVAFMADMAQREEKKTYDDIFNQARKYLYEIASDYNEVYIGVWDKVLTWLWNDIYDGVVVDKEGLARMRNVAKKMPFVVIPCHRSHIDYLFLSYVFYHNNIQMPFIAAGTNLLFWPMGHIFRKSGAFFLRRTFRNDILYSQIFSQYIKVVMQEGYPLEFFIEGGRSRTGKMVMPKYGLLSMVIQAYREGACDNLAVIPVYIGYDTVIEEKSYLKELGGESKAEERTSSLFKSRKVLRKRYGSVYMNVGEPILLKDYLASQDMPVDDMTTEDRQSFYRKMGYEIVGAINKISVVSPISLVAAGLLSHYRRGISHDDLMAVLDEFYDYLSYRKVRFAGTFANKEKALIEALNRFESLGHITRMGPEEDDDEELAETIYSVDEDKRMNLEYYKNNILHFFVPLSFVAASILSTTDDDIPLSKIVEDYSYFKRLFRHEFIFDEAVDDVEEVNTILSYMHDKGMIVGHNGDGDALIEVKGKGRTFLGPYAGLIHNYIESYWITMRGTAYLKDKKRGEKDLVKKIQKLGAKMYKKGEISKAEALSLLNFRNALKFLTEAEILLPEDTQREGKAYSLTDDKSRIESFRYRLFKFM